MFDTLEYDTFLRGGPVKKTLVLIVLICLLSSAHAAHAMDNNNSWFAYFASFIWEPNQTQQTEPRPQPQPSAPYQYQPTSFITDRDREQVRKDTEALIDALFETPKQNKTTQWEIQAIKEKTVSCLKQQARYCTSAQELRLVTTAQFNVCLAEVIATNARLLYEQKAARAKGNSAYNPAYLASQIEADIKAQALKALEQDIRGILILFVGKELEDHIAGKIVRDFPAPKQAAPARPSAPAHVKPTPNNEIYEVYVHPEAKRYEESVTKIQQGRTHRASECCACMDDFGGAKKRVTLACGHSICPECLYAWLYQSKKQSKKNSCPLCRDVIRTDEFPKQYLMKFL